MQIQSCNSPIQWFPFTYIYIYTYIYTHTHTHTHTYIYIYIYIFNIYLFIWLCQVLVATHRIFSCSMWDLVPWPGIEPRPLHWGHGVLHTGLPGKFPTLPLKWKCSSGLPSTCQLLSSTPNPFCSPSLLFSGSPWRIFTSFSSASFSSV